MGGMVEPVSLTLGAIAASLVAKAVEKAVDKAADGAVDEGAGAVVRVVAWVRSRFGHRPELAALEHVPDSARLQTQLGEVIDAELVEDPPSRQELQRLIDASQTANPIGVFHIGSITATQGGVAAAQIVGNVSTTSSNSGEDGGRGGDEGAGPRVGPGTP